VDRGAKVVVIGDEDNARRVSGMLDDLLVAVRNGHTPTMADVVYALDTARREPEDESGEPLPGVSQFLGKDTPAIRQDVRIKPRTHGQREYLDAIHEHSVTLAIGPAGTGKTYLAMAAAVSALLSKRVQRIILTRPAVEAGESLGFLPGDLVEKVNPYLRPLYDALYSMVNLDRVQRLIEQERIEVAPLAFMRGRTLDNAFIILDEAQNTTTDQMLMFLTRLGQNSRAVVTGDITQTDLPKGKPSGLKEAERILQRVPDIAIVKLQRSDVVRNPVVQTIIDAYASDQEARSAVEAVEGARASDERTGT
jgi:phosphate starvation-inducible PhoH-like protein